METWQDLVTLGYEAVGDDAQWPGFLTALRRAVPVDQMTVYVCDQTRRSFPLMESVGIDPKWETRFKVHYAWMGMARSLFAQRPADWLGTWDIPKSAVHGSEFYHDFLAPQGVHHAACRLLARWDGGYLLLASTSARSQDVFGSRPKRVLDRMAVQLRWALALRRKVETSQAAAGFGAWEASAQAVVMLDGSGKIAYLNPAAKRLLEEPCGLMALRDRLSAVRSDKQQALERLVRDAVQLGRDTAQAGGTLSLRAPETGATLQIQVHPLNLAHESLAGRRIAAAVFLTPAGSLRSNAAPAALTHLPSADVLSARFGLTPAEARLALALAQGHELKQAAEALGITYLTARSRLNVIYGKTGTRRQGTLVGKLLGVVPERPT